MSEPSMLGSLATNPPLYPLLKDWTARLLEDEADQRKLMMQTLLRIEDLAVELPVKEALFELMHETFLRGTDRRG